MPNFLPRKTFDWIIEVDGLDQMYVQEIDVPNVELPVILHGEAGRNPDNKTPGKIQVSEMVIKKAMPTETADNWAWSLFERARYGTKKNQMVRNIFFKLTDGFGKILATYVYEDAWVGKIEPGGAFTAGGEGENVIEQVTLNGRDWYKVRE